MGKLKGGSGRETRRPCQPETGAEPVPPITKRDVKKVLKILKGWEWNKLVKEAYKVAFKDQE